MAAKQEQDWLDVLEHRLLEFLWRPQRARSGPGAWGNTALQTIFLAARSAYHGRLPFQASALTFMTLLGLVPALAISFAVAKGLGFAAELEKFLLSSEYTASQSEIFSQIIGYVERTQVGTLGVVGVVVLLIALVLTLSSVEETFNRVWEVRAQRSWLRQFTDYLSVLVIVPLIVVAATTVWAAVSSLELVRQFQHLAWVGPVASWGLGLGPLLMLSAAFVFIYLFLPNRGIPFWSALLGGVVAACLWWGVQSVYIYFQIGVARYNAIYGGFASLPLFFVWLQVSWMVLLFGNELAHAHHLCRRGPPPRVVLPALTCAQREALGLRLMYLAARRFHLGQPPWSLTDLATELGAPLVQVHDLALALAEAELLTRPDAQERVQPARSLESLLVNDVVTALRGDINHAAASLGPEAEAALLDLLGRLRRSREESLGATTLLALVTDQPTPDGSAP